MHLLQPTRSSEIDPSKNTFGELTIDAGQKNASSRGDTLKTHLVAKRRTCRECASVHSMQLALELRRMWSLTKTLRRRGGGHYLSPPSLRCTQPIHGQDDCQVVFENTLLSSLLFSQNELNAKSKVANEDKYMGLWHVNTSPGPRKEKGKRAI